MWPFLWMNRFCTMNSIHRTYFVTDSWEKYIHYRQNPTNRRWPLDGVVTDPRLWRRQGLEWNKHTLSTHCIRSPIDSNTKSHLLLVHLHKRVYHEILSWFIRSFRTWSDPPGVVYIMWSTQPNYRRRTYVKLRETTKCWWLFDELYINIDVRFLIDIFRYTLDIDNHVHWITYIILSEWTNERIFDGFFI